MWAIELLVEEEAVLAALDAAMEKLAQSPKVHDPGGSALVAAELDHLLRSHRCMASFAGARANEETVEVTTVGDLRLALVHEGRALQETTDDIAVNDAAVAGDLDLSLQGSMLTRALGAPAGAQCRTEHWPVGDTDSLVVCSVAFHRSSPLANAPWLSAVCRDDVSKLPRGWPGTILRVPLAPL